MMVICSDDIHTAQLLIHAESKKRKYRKYNKLTNCLKKLLDDK